MRILLTFSKSRNICHAPLKSLLEIEFGVVVYFPVEACSWLLREIIVAIPERCVLENPLDTRIYVQLLVRVCLYVAGG